ncbi:MAG TPA: 50S ribosomal protein L21 [Candidatus Sulfobium mesophilum]|jgi:large subunit ribosomal protein L21|nr:50S ribosomal protein L21 [Candidatus Sulfobium mesophilum]
MYAVIETGGQQHRVVPGETVKVQKIEGTETEISLDKVLLISKDDNVELGAPFVKNAVVKAEVVSHGRHPKVIVHKQRPRKGYRKLNGHRQDYTLLKIKDIVFGG